MTQWFVDNESSHVDMSITVSAKYFISQALRSHEDGSADFSIENQLSPGKNNEIIKDKDFTLVSNFQGEEDEFANIREEKDEIINLEIDLNKQGVYTMNTTLNREEKIERSFNDFIQFRKALVHNFPGS